MTMGTIKRGQVLRAVQSLGIHMLITNRGTLRFNSCSSVGFQSCFGPISIDEFFPLGMELLLYATV